MVPACASAELMPACAAMAAASATPRLTCAACRAFSACLTLMAKSRSSSMTNVSPFFYIARNTRYHGTHIGVYLRIVCFLMMKPVYIFDASKSAAPDNQCRQHEDKSSVLFGRRFFLPVDFRRGFYLSLNFRFHNFKINAYCFNYFLTLKFLRFATTCRKRRARRLWRMRS